MNRYVFYIGGPALALTVGGYLGGKWAYNTYNNPTYSPAEVTAITNLALEQINSFPDFYKKPGDPIFYDRPGKSPSDWFNTLKDRLEYAVQEEVAGKKGSKEIQIRFDDFSDTFLGKGIKTNGQRRLIELTLEEVRRALVMEQGRLVNKGPFAEFPGYEGPTNDLSNTPAAHYQAIKELIDAAGGQSAIDEAKNVCAVDFSTEGDACRVKLNEQVEIARALIQKVIPEISGEKPTCVIVVPLEYAMRGNVGIHGVSVPALQFIAPTPEWPYHGSKWAERDLKRVFDNAARNDLKEPSRFASVTICDPEWQYGSTKPTAAVLKILRMAREEFAKAIGRHQSRPNPGTVAIQSGDKTLYLTPAGLQETPAPPTGRDTLVRALRRVFGIGE